MGIVRLDVNACDAELFYPCGSSLCISVRGMCEVVLSRRSACPMIVHFRKQMTTYFEGAQRTCSTHHLFSPDCGKSIG